MRAWTEAERAGDRRGAELAIVVPTFNERANVVELVRRVERTLVGYRWEILFVDDDSPDGTATVARALARDDARVRILQRVGRRGLASACTEGMLATAAPYVAVMDADLQHDEALLPRMLATLASGDVDVVVGSRYVHGASVDNWDPVRVAGSRIATRLTRRLVRAELSDPLSGFFMLRRDTFDTRVRCVSGAGFKILVDLLTATSAPPRVRELPYAFRPRLNGESKLDAGVAWALALVLVHRWLGRRLPIRFLGFAAIGAIGVVVHLVVLTSLYSAAGVGFSTAQTAATLVAMIANFSLNNLVTYRDRRLRGARWWLGLASFVLVCAVGAVANVGIASYLFDSSTGWALAGIAGVAVGAVWNYAVTAAFTWDGSRRTA